MDSNIRNLCIFFVLLLKIYNLMINNNYKRKFNCKFKADMLWKCNIYSGCRTRQRLSTAKKMTKSFKNVAKIYQYEETSCDEHSIRGPLLQSEWTCILQNNWWMNVYKSEPTNEIFNSVSALRKYIHLMQNWYLLMKQIAAKVIL